MAPVENSLLSHSSACALAVNAGLGFLASRRTITGKTVDANRLVRVIHRIAKARSACPVGCDAPRSSLLGPVQDSLGPENQAKWGDS